MAPECVSAVWEQLESEFGGRQRIGGFNLIQIDARPFLLRATAAGNPITVVRKRDCRNEDVSRLHQILQFFDPADEKSDDQSRFS